MILTTGPPSRFKGNGSSLLLATVRSPSIEVPYIEGLLPPRKTQWHRRVSSEADFATWTFEAFGASSRAIMSCALWCDFEYLPIAVLSKKGRSVQIARAVDDDVGRPSSVRTLEVMEYGLGPDTL